MKRASLVVLRCEYARGFVLLLLDIVQVTRSTSSLFFSPHKARTFIRPTPCMQSIVYHCMAIFFLADQPSSNMFFFIFRSCWLSACYLLPTRPIFRFFFSISIAPVEMPLVALLMFTMSMILSSMGVTDTGPEWKDSSICCILFLLPRSPAANLKKLDFVIKKSPRAWQTHDARPPYK